MNDKEKAKDFFAFSSREQSGLVVLFGIILLLIGYYGVKKYYFKPEVYDFSSFQKEIDAFYAQDIEDSIRSIFSDSIQRRPNYPDDKLVHSKKEFVGFLFNPNAISQAQWEKLGLSPKQATAIIKYRNKGGKFRIKSDLKKMYTVSDKKYQELYPWIDLPEQYDKFSDDKTPFSGNKDDLSSNKPIYSKKKFVGFLFEPNTISQAQWEKLGLSPKQATAIIKYRNKGGKFRIKSDLKKMYMISDKKYQELYSWIDLPEQYNDFSDDKSPLGGNKESFIPNKQDSVSRNFSKIKTSPIPLKSINLNTADTTTLKTIRGIGSYYARKIVEYRNALGGYVSFNQLNEIWKMREETIKAITPYVYIDENDVKKIPINTIDLESLKKHPYVTWNIARVLINYRFQHGKYKTKEDLLKIGVLPEKDFLNLKPYILIE